MEVAHISIISIKYHIILNNFQIGINNAGQIQYLNITYYSDCGYCFNDAAGDFSDMMITLYDTSRWQIEGYSVLTDKAGMTWCRAPGKLYSS